MKPENLIIVPLFVFLAFPAISQMNFWKKTEVKGQRDQTSVRLIIPEKYETFSFDLAAFRAFHNASARNVSNSFTMSFPLPDGTLEDFKMTETPVFDDGLSKKYKGFSSFSGKGLSSHQISVKMSLSPFGINVLMLDHKEGSVYIDPYTPSSELDYIVYYKKDFIKKSGKFTCGVAADIENKTFNPTEFTNLSPEGTSQLVSDCRLRTYRLALASTGEYAKFHGSTIEKVLAAYNNSITRVNAIYERDAAITLKLVSDTDKLIFLNAATDPYTNTNGSAMLGQNQTTIDNIIGFPNYDIGHVFSTGGGGIAQLRAPCSASKAEGVTGSAAPIGDPFDIDYVAHEMGHQFGANHTQNNSCQRNGNTAIEPGSASSIMGYAGICDPNVQNNSDDHFHAVSLAEIANFVVAGSGNGCAVKTDIDNLKPEVNVSKSSYTIPKSTAFQLTAEGTDPDGDLLTYCWEQVDNEVATMPPKTNNTSGPAFRSLSPTSNPTRYFPDLQRRYNLWEVLPAVSRTLKFRCTVRDNNALGGCTDEVNMEVKVNDQAGPFMVTFPNSVLVNWQVGTKQTVTWDKAKTDEAPFNCSLVNILLSSDGGKSYPVTLASKVPNTGSFEIETPNLPSNTTKVMVAADDNIFFDVSNSNFKITTSFKVISDISQVDICDQTDVNVLITLEKVQDINQNIELTLDNPPVGLQYHFSSNPVALPGTSTLHLTDLTSLPLGKTNLKILATTGNEKLSTVIELFVGNKTPEQVITSSPANFSQTINPANTTFEWNGLAGVKDYTIEIAESPSFLVLYKTATTSATKWNTNLVPDKVWYWRVKGNSPCLDLPFGPTSSFKTSGGNSAEARLLTNEVLLVSAGQSALINEAKIDISNDDVQATSIVITSLPVFGVLTIQNEPVAIGTVLSLEDIKNNYFSYTHSGGTEENDGFSFDVTDDQTRWLPGVQFKIQIRQTNLGIAAFKQQGLRCFGDTDGSILAEGYGGTGPYSYSMDNTNFQTDPIFQNLTAGSYAIFIKDQNGGLISSNTIILTEPEAITLELVRSNYDIVAIASGGTGNLQLSLDDVSYDMTSTFPDPGNGTYTIYVKDENDCKVSSEMTIDISPLYSSSTIVNDILCSGQKAVIQAIAGGGVPPYTYSADGQNFQTNPSFSLNAGKYSITVKDSGNKTFASDTVYTSSPAPIVIVLLQNKLQVVVQVTGGTGAFEYGTNGINYTTNDTIQFTDNGTYKIYVRDANNCLKTINISLNILNAVNKTVKHVTCFGKNNGSINLLAANGSFPFQYSLNGAPFSTVREWTNLSPASYSYVVKDNKNDSLSGVIIISEPEELMLGIQIDLNTITIIGTGGTPPYVYSIDSGGVYLDNSIFNELPDNEYDVVIKDKNGCITNGKALITGIETTSISGSIGIYPNPGSDIFQLISDELSLPGTKVNVTHLTGQHINLDGRVTKNTNEWWMDMSHLPAGAYHLKMTSIFGVSSKLFIKI
ncbi:MAG: T9SS type A sorting domain-containing protein [Saprospiraceae bacterium]|nr:T9SS type A sorting domain-containing protein [Saprospiraceae bacterium]